MHLVSERGDSRPLAVTSATILLAVVALLVFANRAQAAETLYWNNYSGEPDSIAFANVDGAGGGTLNLGGTELDGPEGMAYDSVTNRIYVAAISNGDKGQIVFVNLDNSGAGVLNTPGVTVESPEGLAVDPATRTLYWINTGGTPESIGWARLDGSAAGLLNTSGATVDGAYRLAIDPVAQRVYWGNTGGTNAEIHYANYNNTGGGMLSLDGATTPDDISGLAVVPSLGRIYWLDEDRVSYANLSGGSGGDLNLSGGVFDGPYGLSIDPATNKIYWANYDGGDDERTNALGFGSLSGGGGGITVSSAPVEGPQDPLLLKSPVGTGAPTIARNPKLPAELACSTGTWAADLPGSFVYQAPRTLTYQWSLNGAVLGAGPERITATAPGQYTCTVTATNQTGTAAQTSAVVNVKASKVKLSTKRKAKADPGDLVTFQVKIVNQGDVQSKNARICVQLPNAAKDDLRKPKCKKLRSLTGLAKRTTKFRVKVKPGADEGADKLTFQVKGTPGKAAKSKIIVR